MNAKPNILWLFCEDLSPWLPMYGDPTVASPNLERLAAAGTVFTRCYSPAPVCSPARSGIITGCMPTTIGVHNHVTARPGEPAQPLPPHVRTLPELLREAGYYTFNFGKDDYNFDYDRHQLYAGPYETIKFYGAHAVGASGRETAPKDWRSQWRARAPGQPFFGQFTLWGGKNKRQPPTPTDPASVTLPPYYPDLPVFRELIAAHYDHVRITDLEVGEILAALEDDGLLTNTAIFFFGDHGYCLLRHKQFCYEGGVHVPLIAASPGSSLLPAGGSRSGLVSSLDVTATTLAAAGLAIPPWMESRDLFAPGYRRDYVISARDRCDFTIDRIRAVRGERFRYIRNFMTDRPLLQPQYRDRSPQYTDFRDYVRAGRASPVQAQLWSAVRPVDELYDLAEDPHETVNLVDNPGCAHILAEMRAILARWIVATGDRGQVPESREQLQAIFERWGADRCVNPEYDQFRQDSTLAQARGRDYGEFCF